MDLMFGLAAGQISRGKEFEKILRVLDKQDKDNKDASGRPLRRCMKSVVAKESPDPNE